MFKKFYVHHFYTKSLFYKLAHNTKNRKYNIQNKVGNVICEYFDLQLEFIFEPELNDNDDGDHIIDFLTILSQLNEDLKYNSIDCFNKSQGQDAHRGKGGAQWGVNDIPILRWIVDNLVNKKNWFIFLLRTEKSFIKYDGIVYPPVRDLELQIERLRNHKIFTDNYFIDKNIEANYPNHNFLLTNTIFEWNDLLSIRWYYEFKNIFEKLNHPYDLCFSMRYHKRHRIDIINELSKLDNKKIYLSRVDNCKNSEFYKYKNRISKINYNITEGNDFADLTYIENIKLYLDYFMRILPMSKMHIVSETWDWVYTNLTSNYLSEKTYGLLLANIPFITIHPYPLEIVSNILNIKPHPFYSKIKNIKSDAVKFSDFIKEFMENYEINYELCKKWVSEAHEKLIEQVNTKNSFLDLVLSNNFYNIRDIPKKTII
jgi:predicted CopG family antitoxin